MTSYKDKNGNNLLLKSFCAYFDILGFSEKIKGEDYGFFEKYLTVLQQQLVQIKSRQRYSDNVKVFELKVFTDNFVLGYPWSDEYGETELGTLFNILSQLQYTFACQNIFIRGAISLSDLFMDENIVIGKALIEAYRLEQEKAVYPRIILSEDVRAVVEEHIGYYNVNENSPQFEHYLVDIDGQIFVNYLMYSIRSAYGDNQHIESSLMQHKMIVEANIKEHNENFLLFEKFAWVGRYHNYFCDTFLESKEVDIKSLKIEEAFLFKKIRRNHVDVKHLSFE